MNNSIILLTILSTALIAGLFYSYSCSVNAGLGKLSDVNYLSAMQSINKEILNPAFFASFLGTVILLPVCTWLHYKTGTRTEFFLLLSATLLYVIGTFGVTMLGNVPLNNALENFDIKNSSALEISNQRKIFEIPWNKLHLIRTLANIASLTLILLAKIKFQ